MKVNGQALFYILCICIRPFLMINQILNKGFKNIHYRIYYKTNYELKKNCKTPPKPQNHKAQIPNRLPQPQIENYTSSNEEKS